MIDGKQRFNTSLKDFEANGASAIDRLAKENPLAYLWLIVGLVCDVQGFTYDEQENEA